MLILSIWFGCGLIGVLWYFIEFFKDSTKKDLKFSDLLCCFFIFILGVMGIVCMAMVLIQDKYGDRMDEFWNRNIFK
jgi:hypothetical protein